MVDDASGLDVVKQLAYFTRGVVVVDVHRYGARLQASGHHVGVQIVVHEQRDTVLAALPALELIPLAVGSKSPTGEEIRQPPRPLRRLTECAAAVPADGHRPIGNDVGDGVEHRPYGPLGHGFWPATPAIPP